VESEIDLGAAPPGPNGQTSSRDVPKDGDDDDDDVALVDALAGDCSLPCQQTSLPTPVTATLTNRLTKAELLPPAKAAMSEAEGPKTETTPLGAMRAPPVESETKVAAAPAGPNGQTSPCDVQKDGDGKDGVALADALLGDSSRPCGPTSIPTPVKENVTDGSTNAELLRPAKAAMREGSQTESTLLGTIGRKRGRSGDRQLKKQKPPAGISKAGPKLSPKLMRLVLNALRECPILSHAADTAGIHRKALKYWMDRSEAGDDGYDIKWQGLTWRFHEHCKSAIWEAHLELIDIMFQRASVGYDKVLTYQGRVMYKIDQGLVGLGYQGPDAYLKDENGNPIKETVRKVDMKAMRFILEWYRPDTWVKHRKIDAPREGGVLVIGDVTKKPKYNTDASVMARKWKAGSRMIREEKE
jgi:hypothetical protein